MISPTFPWLQNLPEAQRREFFEELADQIAEAASWTPGVSSQAYLDRIEPVITKWQALAGWGTS